MCIKPCVCVCVDSSRYIVCCPNLEWQYVHYIYMNMTKKHVHRYILGHFYVLLAMMKLISGIKATLTHAVREQPNKSQIGFQ